MGIYLNPTNAEYQELRNSKIVVDKSLLIEKTNQILNTTSKNICISRPRRFGKSTDANMLVAYYSKDCDSHTLFDDLKVAKADSYEKHLNKHNVIRLNIQDFLSLNPSVDDLIASLNRKVIKELKRHYDEYCSEMYLSEVLSEIFAYANEKFIVIIDEWDCIFREFKEDKEAQEKYLDFLRNLLKDKPYVEMCYMTGILPVKKYGTHSALNMFKEISMLQSLTYSKFMGFTEDEVKLLCEQNNMDFHMMQEWYDGYHLGRDVSVYSPRSVVSAIEEHEFHSYWSQTETFEALKEYIDLNFDGLKDDIVTMIADGKVRIDATSFQNDMATFHSKEDVLTLLIHLGYLGYDLVTQEVYIPNNEVKGTFITSIKASNWNKVTEMFRNSNNLLEATWNGENDKVAVCIEKCHYETSILQYHDENALAYTIYLSYITAKDYYTVVREFPTGKGFADIVFIPKSDKPAMIIELKYDKDIETGITQIKNKNYPEALENYRDNLLLVSVNYDKKNKKHECSIEKYVQ